MTKEVFANWVELSPVAAVGVVGLPVKEGEAMVALNKIASVLAVILDVFADIALVLLVILDVFADIVFVLLVILAVLADIELVLLVILAVLAAINVGSVPIVVELIPPTLLIVVVNVPVPLPLTSPVKVIN